MGLFDGLKKGHAHDEENVRVPHTGRVSRLVERGIGTHVVPGCRVYLFKRGHSQGTKDMKQLLGGKGANLCEMSRIGLNVPPGFTITTACCAKYAETGALPEGLWEEVLSSLSEVEEAFGAKFADPEAPLLLSVRSGAASSMPGEEQSCGHRTGAVWEPLPSPTQSLNHMRLPACQE